MRLVMEGTAVWWTAGHLLAAGLAVRPVELVDVSERR